MLSPCSREYATEFDLPTVRLIDIIPLLSSLESFIMEGPESETLGQFMQILGMIDDMERSSGLDIIQNIFHAYVTYLGRELIRPGKPMAMEDRPLEWFTEEASIFTNSTMISDPARRRYLMRLRILDKYDMEDYIFTRDNEVDEAFNDYLYPEIVIKFEGYDCEVELVLCGLEETAPRVFARTIGKKVEIFDHRAVGVEEFLERIYNQAVTSFLLSGYSLN